MSASNRSAPLGDLRGTTALVTGAAGLVGGHVADVLAERGVRLVLTDLDTAAIDERAGALRDRGARAEALTADLTEPDQLEALDRRAAEALAPVDILVNNAYVELTSRFDRLTREELDVQVAVNLRAPMELTRVMLPGMLERGRGHVVNVASLTGKLAFAYKAHYAAAKAGLIAFSHALSRELRRAPVGVSVICPALIAEGGVSQRAREEGLEPPRVAGTCSPREVAEAVERVILKGKPELVVSPRPTFLVSALQATVPALAWRLLGLSGMPDYWARVARDRGRA